jgi:hypothetical protein
VKTLLDQLKILHTKMEDSSVLSSHLTSDQQKNHYHDHVSYEVTENHSVQHHIPLQNMPLQAMQEHPHHLPPMETDSHNYQLDYQRYSEMRGHIEEGVSHMGSLDTEEQLQQMESHLNNQLQSTEMENSIGNSKKRKQEKDTQMNTCLAVGCDRQIKHRRLCPMHQKQKERSGGKLELKENIKIMKGRVPTPFSRHANKYAKLKAIDKKIDEWAGGREEGTAMLESYLESNYYSSRFSRNDENRIYESIGRNIVEFMKQLPDKSPLRRPLIKAMSENIPLSRLREVLPVSKQTVINSKRLTDQENLLLTIKYRPNVTRSRNKRGDGLDISGSDETLVGALVGSEELAYANDPRLSSTMNINTMNGMQHNHLQAITGYSVVATPAIAIATRNNL